MTKLSIIGAAFVVLAFVTQANAQTAQPVCQNGEIYDCRRVVEEGTIWRVFGCNKWGCEAALGLDAFSTKEACLVWAEISSRGQGGVPTVWKCFGKRPDWKENP